MKNLAVKEPVEKSGLRPVVFKSLPGLEYSKRFILHLLEGNPFYFLQSADEQAVGLALLDPFSFSRITAELVQQREMSWRLTKGKKF